MNTGYEQAWGVLRSACQEICAEQTLDLCGHKDTLAGALLRAEAAITLPDPTTNGVGPSARGSDTSRSAAVAAYPRSGVARGRILEHIAETGPATRDDLTRVLGMPDSTTDPRVWELVKYGWLEELPATRATRAGSAAHLLDLTVKAREEYVRRCLTAKDER